MPHSPWAYLPSGARYDAPEDLPNDGAGWVDLARQRHLAQLGYTDRLIGETLRTLRATGLYDQALVVVTADHGVSFRRGAQGRGMDAIKAAAGEVAWVPMFVKEPGQQSRPGGRPQLGTRRPAADQSPTRPTSGCPGGSTAAPPGRPRATDGTTSTSTTAPANRSPSPAACPPRRPCRHPTPWSAPQVRAGPAAGSARVADLAAFTRHGPGHRHPSGAGLGDVPDRIPDGTLLAVAVNGRIGAVVPVVPADPGGRRFAALLTDDRLFRAGTNQLDVYQVATDGTLRRLALS